MPFDFVGLVFAAVFLLAQGLVIPVFGGEPPDQ